MLDIKESCNGDKLEIYLTGRLDTTTSPKLEGVLKEVKGINTLVFDMSEVSYISSTGLRVVLLAHKLMAGTRTGKLYVRNPSTFCKQVFEATGMDSLLTFSDGTNEPEHKKKKKE